jgi:abortive infection Abi-like protein
VARHIEGAVELLDQAVGVRNRTATVTAARRHESLMAFAIESGWEKHVRRWFSAARQGLRRYLQEQLEDVMPVLALGLPPDDGKPQHRIGLDNGEPWLRKAVEELQEVQAALGVRRGVSKAAPAPARFEELHASGLVAEKVIDDHAKDMVSPHTPKQLYNAIGSAKELTEATLRAALDRLGESYGRGGDLPVLMKKWRRAVGTLAPPDPQGEPMLDRAQAALASLVTFLAEWRNTYGRGHGRPQYPPGLRARHARLAADAAETCVRFIITTMDDFQLLPP